jgi:hypothetical protein
MTAVSTAGWVIGYDAVTWQDMPEGVFHYLYCDGDYAAPAEAYTELGRQGRIATIAVLASTDADEYDYENGNQDTPVAWAQRMVAKDRNFKPKIYASEANAPAVERMFAAAGAPQPYFRIAAWGGKVGEEVTVYGAGTLAVQILDENHYDVDLISPDYPTTLGTAPAPPAPEPTEEDDMLIIYVNGTDDVYGLSGGKVWHIADIESLCAYQTAGIKSVHVTSEELAALQA